MDKVEELWDATYDEVYYNRTFAGKSNKDKGKSKGKDQDTSKGTSKGKQKGGKTMRIDTQDFDITPNATGKHAERTAHYKYHFTK